MIICPNCGKELADSSKFCDTCGSKIEQIPAAPATEADFDVNAFEIESPKAVDLDATVAVNSGYRDPETEAPANEQADVQNRDSNVPPYDPMVNESPEVLNSDKTDPKNKKKMLGILFGAIAGVVAVVLIVVLIVALGGKSGHNYAIYYKDGEVNYTKLPSAKPTEVSDKDGASAKLTPNGKYIVYIDDYDDDKTLSLKKTSKLKKDAVSVKDDVSSFRISDNSKYIVFMADGNLYEYNIAKKVSEKVKNDVSEYYIYEDSDKVVYYVSDDETKDCYVKTLGKDQEIKVASEVTDIEFVTTDCDDCYYIEDGTLYYTKVGKDAKEIDDDVTDYISAVYEDGSIYYKRYEDEDEGTVSLLYYTGKGEPAVIFEDFDSISVLETAIEKPIGVFSVLEDWNDDEDSISYVVSYGNATEITHDDAQSFTLTENGSVLYYVADVEYSSSSETVDSGDEYYSYDYEESAAVSDDEGEFEYATLFQAKIGKKGITKTVEYDTEVYDELYLVDNKTIAYFKDYDLEDDNGTLYVNKKEIDSEVEIIHYSYTDTNTFLYVKDVKDSTATVFLCKNGKKSVKVDDDIYNIAFTGKGDLIYLKDYDTDDSEGDLYFFKGSKSKLVDEKVSGFVPDPMANTSLSY